MITVFYFANLYYSTLEFCKTGSVRVSDIIFVRSALAYINAKTACRKKCPLEGY